MFLTPPTKTTFFVSIVLAILAVFGNLMSAIANYSPVSMLWLAVAAYIVLFLGNVVRGL
jgi:hypothetical protein